MTTETMINFKMHTVDSKNIKEVGYCKDTEKLLIEFSYGGKYIYHSVTSKMFDGLMQSPSAGSYLSSVIKPNCKFDKVA